MSGTPVRVAVQEGTDAVRVASADVDGSPWLLAELPAPGPGTAVLLAELVGPVPEELVLVHPGQWSDARAREWAQQHAGLAVRVRAVPAPLAAAGRGGVAVLDVGAAGAEAALLAADGGIRACATADVGGRALDALLAARWPRDGVAREVREALSLLPAVDGIAADELDAVLAGPLGAAVEALRTVLAGAPAVPVLLVGGVARSPLLARLVDEAGIAAAVVAPRPDAAAVLGALALPAGIDHAGPAAPSRALPGVVPPVDGHARGEGSGADAHGSQVDAPAERLLPPLPPRRRRPLRTALLAIGAAAAVALLLAAGRLLAPPGGGEVAAGVLVQYGYRLDVPAGWEHTGGLPERRRVLLTPVSAPEGSDLIAVERSPLGYDVAAEPERARAELRTVFDTAVAHGSRLSGYDPDARFAGRAVTSYRQEDGRTVVDWFVVLVGDAQLSVGCRHTTAGAAAVAAACAVVVGSVGGA